MLVFNLLSLLRAFNSNRFPKVEKISKLGILGVRIAQLYSTRIDILSKEMCHYLMNVHSSIVPVKEKNMLKILNKENNPLYLLEFFDNEPYRTSYVSQIYTGTLKNGQDVVIKFPDMESKYYFLKRIKKLEKAAKIIAFWFPALSRKFSLNEFISSLKESSLRKADLFAELIVTKELNEIRNQYCDKYDLKNLNFSEFFSEYSNAAYLISKYRSTHSVKNLLEDVKMKAKYVKDIIRFQFFYIFVVGKFHSDVHRGNILIGDGQDEGKIFFIDSNSLCEISDNFRINTFYFLLNLSRNDLEKAFHFLNHLAIKRVSQEQEKLLYDKFVLFFHDISKKSLGEISFCKQLVSFFKIAINIEVEYPEDLFEFLKALIRLEDIEAETIHTAIFIDTLREVLTLFENDEKLNINNLISN